MTGRRHINRPDGWTSQAGLGSQGCEPSELKIGLAAHLVVRSQS